MLHYFFTNRKCWPSIDLLQPIDVWNEFFPSSPYRYSILLTVHGTGVLYSNSEVREKMDLNFYDSNKL